MYLAATTPVASLAGPTSLGAGDLLKLAPQGAYSTARTCAGRSRVFELTAHIERTASSCALIRLKTPGVEGVDGEVAAPASLHSASFLRPIMEGAFGAVVDGLTRLEGGAPAPGSPEVKLTLLVTWTPANVDAALALVASHGGVASPLTSPPAESPYVVLAHATLLPKRRAPPVIVHVRGAPRHNALAKDSEWVR